jgi:hypothetical protein
MEDQTPKKSNKGPLIIIGIVIMVIVGLVGSAFLFSYFKCGSGGSISCSSGNGCYCLYSFMTKDSETKTQCPDCKDFCQTKGKSKFIAYGQPTQNIPISNIKRLPNESWDIETGPIQCFCTCK